jgi:hypothetical protein
MVTFCNYPVNASKMIQCNAMANRNLLNILVLSLKVLQADTSWLFSSGDTPGYRDLVGKLKVVQHAKKFPPFIEHKGL